MKIQKESQILDQEFRVSVIKEIIGNENNRRKGNDRRTYDLLKDKTKKWVLHGLKEEGLAEGTIQTMANRASNVSIFRKVVEKLARAYLGGVERTAGTPVANTQVTEMERLLNFDQKQKKADKWLEAFKNCAIQIIPVLNERESTDENKVKDIKMRIFAPYQYDVLNSAENPEEGRVFILSDFVDKSISNLHPFESNERKTNMPISSSSDGVDQSIADANDGDSMEFIFWSDAYHFTCNKKGEIVTEKSPENFENPIGIVPFIDLKEDQDGVYWAEGGDDLVDSAILVNKLITDMNSIAYQQGWGQPVITGGMDLKENFTVGTQNALVFKYDQETEPTPTVDIIQGNPPIKDWLSLIEQYVALTLSTNSLTPGNISMRLDANSFQSGIAKMLEQAEANNDIVDKQKYFKAIERQEWNVISLWQNLLLEKNALSKEFVDIGKMPEPLDIKIKFHDMRPPISEKDKLEVIALRKALGIDTEIELLKRDNPDLSDEEAEEKLLKLKEEQLKAMARVISDVKNSTGDKTKIDTIGSDGNQES